MTTPITNRSTRRSIGYLLAPGLILVAFAICLAVAR